MKKLSKKGKIITVIIAVVVILGGVLWFKDYHKNSDTSETSDASKSTSEVSKANVKEEKIDSPSKDTLETEDISGYKQGDNENKNKDKKEDKLEIGNLKLPYKVQGTNMVIESIGQYTGEFLEDGSDKPTANVISLVVKNNSNKVIQYGEINLKVNNKDKITFKVSNLPAKTSVLVMESTGKVEFNKDDKYECLTPVQATLDSMSLMEDKIEIVKAEDGLISIKNKSDKDFDTVYVYYKYYQKGGAYLGGITYRVKFENVKAGETVEEKTSHYSKDFSEILMVDAINS